MTEEPVRSEWVTVATEDGAMRTYLAATSSAVRGVVVVLQEAFGVNAHIISVANRFAGSGYLALAPDLFHRAGVETVSYDDRDNAMRLIAGIGRDQIKTDVAAVVDLARSESGHENCAVVGFCFGGRAAFTAGCMVDGIGAVASFYGPGIAAGPHGMLDHLPTSMPRVLLVYGGADPTISQEERTAIDEALFRAGARHESRVYPDAAHAFFCDARPAAFRPREALDAWHRLQRFLDPPTSQDKA